MEKHIALMCRYQRQWADVSALVCSRTRKTCQTQRDGTNVLEVGEWGRLQSAPISPTFPWHLARAQADILVVHTPNPTAELSCLLARQRAKIVVRYHSDVVRQANAMRIYRPFLMRFLHKADIILPTSEPYLNTSDTLRPFAAKCRVVPLGILPEEFQNPDPARVRNCQERYGGDFVLFSGMHRYYKGIQYLVRAARDIRAQVVIAGDGPERPACIALAQ